MQGRNLKILQLNIWTFASLPFTKRGDKYNYVSCHNWRVKKNMFLGNTAISEYYIASLPFTKRGNSVLVDVTVLFGVCLKFICGVSTGTLLVEEKKDGYLFFVHLGLLMRDVPPPGSAGPHVNDSKHSAAEMTEVSQTNDRARRRSMLVAICYVQRCHVVCKGMHGSHLAWCLSRLLKLASLIA